MHINDILQWTGTACLLTMYTIMSFYPHLYPWNIVAGVAGAICYLTWTMRVSNRPQMLVNVVALGIGTAGLVRAWA
jgi:hypothetical protein